MRRSGKLLCCTFLGYVSIASVLIEQGSSKPKPDESDSWD